MTPAESYLGDEIEKLENERTRLITKLDICRASLQLSTQEHQKLDNAYMELEGKLKIMESLLESEQTILKLRTCERDKLTKELEAAHTLWNDAVRQLEEKDKELEAANDLISVLNKENKNLSDNYHNRLLDIEELQRLLKASEETNKELKKLLDDVLNDVQYADHKIDKDLYNEIKAALK